MTESMHADSKQQQVSRFVLAGKSNWHLWKTDVLLWAMNRESIDILYGIETAPTTMSSSSMGLMETHSRTLSLASSTGSSMGEEIERRRAIKDFNRRQSGLHMAMNNAMNEHHRVLTLNCSTPSQIWTRLCGLYESRSTSDILVLQEKFHSIHLSSPSQIPKFLDELQVATNALAVAGEPLNDSQIALHIINKLPPQMDDIRRSMKFGHPDMLQLPNVEATLLRYHQALSQESKRTAEFAATAREENKSIDKTQSECFDCGMTGHWRGDPACKNPKPRSRYRRKPKPRNEAHVALHAFSATKPAMKTWILDSAATTSMSANFPADNKIDGDVVVGGGHTLESKGTCSVKRIGNLDIENVLVVPEMKTNFFQLEHCVIKVP